MNNSLARLAITALVSTSLLVAGCNDDEKTEPETTVTVTAEKEDGEGGNGNDNSPEPIQTEDDDTTEPGTEDTARPTSDRETDSDSTPGTDGGSGSLGAPKVGEVPAKLSAGESSFFTTLCNGATRTVESAGQINPTSLEEAKRQSSRIYRDMGRAASDTATRLKPKTGDLTFEGGKEWGDWTVQEIDKLGQLLNDSAAKINATTEKKELEDLVRQIERDLAKENQDGFGMAVLSPSSQQTIKTQVAACKNLFGS